jgi:hypothetical protein
MPTCSAERCTTVEKFKSLVMSVPSMPNGCPSEVPRTVTGVEHLGGEVPCSRTKRGAAPNSGRAASSKGHVGTQQQAARRPQAVEHVDHGVDAEHENRQVRGLRVLPAPWR